MKRGKKTERVAVYFENDLLLEIERLAAYHGIPVVVVSDLEITTREGV